MPGLITCGWSSETRRLIIGFSQIARPMPWPILQRERRFLVGEAELLRLRPHSTHFRRRAAGPDRADRRVEIVAAALVGVDQRWRRRADREGAVVAGAVAHVGVQDVVVHRIARTQHAVGEHVRVRAAALARDRVDAFDVLRAEIVEHFADERRRIRSRACPASSPRRARRRRHRPSRIAAVEQRDLVLGLDLARVGHQLLAVDDRDALRSAARTAPAARRRRRRRGSLCRPRFSSSIRIFLATSSARPISGRHRAAHQSEMPARERSPSQGQLSW